MKKFFVIYCKNNLYRPAIYIGKSTATKKAKQITSYQIKQFEKEIDAEKFIFPKKLCYLMTQEQLEKRNLNFTDTQKKHQKSIRNTDDYQRLEQVTQKQLKQNKPGTKTERKQQTQNKLNKLKLQKPLNVYNQITIKQEQVKQQIQTKQQKVQEAQINKKQQLQTKSKKKATSRQNAKQKSPSSAETTQVSSIKNQLIKNKLIDTQQEQTKDITNQKQYEQQQETQQSEQKQRQMIDFEFKIQELETQVKTKTQRLSIMAKVNKIYQQLLCHQGGPKFNKSTPKKIIRSNLHYYGFFDGCSKDNPGQSGTGYHVMNSQSQPIFQKCLNIGKKTNNQAEFYALIYCLLDCKHNGINKLTMCGDSQLVVDLLNQNKKAHNEILKCLYFIAKYLSKSFSHFEIKHVERKRNSYADKLCNKGVKLANLCKKK